MTKKQTAADLIIKETNIVPIVYSVRFLSYIRNMLAVCGLNDSDKDKDIVASFYNMIGKKSDISFIDLTDKEDTVSFIPADKVYRIYKKDFKEVKRKEFLTFVRAEEEVSGVYKHIKGYTGVWNNSRTEIKIGKLLKKFNKTLTNKEIEIFVNKFKALYKSKNNPDFSLVSGDEIDRWYDEENYAHTARGDEGIGTLGKSCMRHGDNYFEIYTNNPKVCQLLILKSNKKLIGRALVWKLNNGQTYMDRIYTHFDSDVHMFREYAMKRKWLTHYDNIKKCDIEKMEVTIAKKSYNYFPYLDTLLYYHTKRSVLSNKSTNSEIVYTCQKTNGTADY